MVKVKDKKLVLGVGINDADYTLYTCEVVGGKRSIVWRCPHYSTWKDMLLRCYSTKFQEKNPTYKGCSVAEEWLRFSNFKRWMEKQDWEGNQIDKDLIFSGNKVYSPKTCIFVSGKVNAFIVECDASRGEWRIGGSWHKSRNKFRSYCRNPFTKKLEHLGMFTCEEEAHQAWLKRKMELAYELAAIQTDERVGKALIDRYTNYGCVV